MAGMADDWARLALAVRNRRTELRLSQDAIRAAGGPSDVVLSRIEKNEEPHPRGNTLQKLDGPLLWQPGSALRVLSGGEPTNAEGFRPEPDVRDLDTDTLIEELRRRLASQSPPGIPHRLGDDPEAGNRWRGTP